MTIKFSSYEAATKKPEELLYYLNSAKATITMPPRFNTGSHPNQKSYDLKFKHQNQNNEFDTYLRTIQQIHRFFIWLVKVDDAGKTIETIVSP